MSLSKEVYKLIQYIDLANNIKSSLYAKLIELKVQYPIYLKDFNSQCIINDVKIKEIDQYKWFIIEVITAFGNIEYIKIPENLTKLKSIEYEYMKQSILNCKDEESIRQLINSKYNIVNMYSKRINKDKEFKKIIKQYLN